MASLKKPGFIVETKPILERKRRKSDLVVMWQSFWDVTMFIAIEMWATLLGIWEMTKKFVYTDEHWEIRTWLEKYLTDVPDDFSESWRDGILLCKLLNKLQPGCYPNAEKLDVNFGLSNLSRAFHILETRFNVIPKVTVEEVVTCRVGSDTELLKLLLQLRQKTNDAEYDVKIPEEPSQTNEDKSKISSDSKNCIAKGTGLMVGFVRRAASFVVFHSSVSDLNLVVEIKGPSNSMCSERITNRSPKKKKTVKPWKPCSPYNFVRSPSNEEDGDLATINIKKTMTNDEKYRILLEYEIHSNQINFTYVPVVKGSHQITILSHGQNVSDSPYLVMVEPVVTTHRNISKELIKSVLKHTDNLQNHEEHRKKSTVRFQEPSEGKERLGKIIKRKVLRYVVKIDKKDVVVETDSIDNLATSLLKMDYEFQKRPLNRRNSWGFVGDAERKVSVIRQFCVDLDELEKQSAKMQRSNSLTLSSKSKKPVRKSSSYECEDIVQQTKLETVTEGTVSNFQDSSSLLNEEYEVFAYLNIDFDSNSRKKVESTRREQTIVHTNSVKSFEYETPKEPLFEKKVTKEVNQSLETSQIQMLADSEILETQNQTNFDGVPADRLTSASDSSSRFDIQEISEGSVSSVCETDVNSVSLENCEKEHIIDTQSDNCQIAFQREGRSDCPLMSRRFGVIESSSQELEISENTDDVFIEELPFTKTDKRTLNNQRYQRNVDVLSTDPGVKLNKDQNSNCILSEQTLSNVRVDNMVEIEKISNSTESIKSKFLKGINSSTMLDCFVKNDYGKCVQRYSENITSKIKNKKLHTNMKTSRMKTRRVLKYQYPRSKVPSHYISSYERKHRNSSKGLKDLNEQKLQCSLQHVQSVESSPLSCRELKKSGKSRATSEPTNFSPKHEEARKKLENHLMRRLSNNNSYEIKENNFKHGKYLSTKGELQHNSYLPHPCSEAEQTQKECEKRLNDISSSVRREYPILPLSLQNNYSNLNFSEDINLNKTHFLPQEASLPDILKINRNQSVNSISCEYSNDFTRLNPIPKASGQFNFKHFNPPLRSDRESPVRKQIKHWEDSMASGGDKPVSKNVQKLHVLPDLVNIKAKLKFWEHANNRFLKEGLKDGGKLKKDTNSEGSEKVDDKTTDVPEFSLGTNLKGKTKIHVSKDEHLHSAEAENIVSLEKNIGGKLLFNTDPSKTRKRSFSDPCVLEPSEKETNGDIQQLEYGNDIINPSSSKDEMSSSYDGNFIEFSADDEDSSGELFRSTEDEYIDDEISENIPTYWGDLSIMKGLNFSDISDYKEFFDLMTSDGFSNQNQSFQLCAAQCKFFGIATYFGHVAVKNRFWVLTKGAGRGNLSVSVQGFGQHNVAFVGVQYTQKDIYEVTYQVFIPGLYLISVRWMDVPIAGSPFLCKVTF